MEPKYVVYECENCGKSFYRTVKEVLVDDADHCEVLVNLIGDEEFPMCACIADEDIEAHQNAMLEILDIEE